MDFVEITIKPKPVGLSFLAMSVFLTLAHSILLFIFYRLENPHLFVWVQWFDLDIEKNIPSFYSSFAILVCAFLFFFIGIFQELPMGYQKLGWFGLSAVFLFLSMDEAFKIHETIGDIVENYIHATGYLYFPWVLPYGFALILFLLVYSKFLFGLPKQTAVFLILSGAAYLTGAVFFDMLGGREAELNGYDSPAYCVLYTIEEFLEMVAIAGLIYTLLGYMEKQCGYLSISLRIRKNA